MEELLLLRVRKRQYNRINYDHWNIRHDITENVTQCRQYLDSIHRTFKRQTLNHAISMMLLTKYLILLWVIICFVSWSVWKTWIQRDFLHKRLTKHYGHFVQSTSNSVLNTKNTIRVFLWENERWKLKKQRTNCPQY